MKVTKISARTKKNLHELITRAQNERIVLTVDGEAAAVLLTIDEFRSTIAMIDLAGDIERLDELYEIHERVQREDFTDFEPIAEKSDETR